IAVIGAVTSPQVYSVSGQKYLLDMLSMAGGLTKDAGDICYVIRPLDTDKTLSQTETIVIDLKELLIKGNIALNIPVFNGDVINVPKGGVVFVDGAVEKPGAFSLQQNTTLVQAVAMAGGLRFEADKSNIKVFRDRGDGTRDIITVDYEKIRDGQMKDIWIVDNDIIIVPKSGMKNFFSGFLNAIKGLISFGKAL
ncbi:MAG: polysaccharide biosynthesis/export family protein, partial [Thermodesulfovibrionales bacterium]